MTPSRSNFSFSLFFFLLSFRLHKARASGRTNERKLRNMAVREDKQRHVRLLTGRVRGRLGVIFVMFGCSCLTMSTTPIA